MVTLALFATCFAWAQAPAGRAYVPITPCRIVDTRIPSPNPLVANTTRTFNVVGSSNDFGGQGGKVGGCGIPGFLGPSMPQVQAVMFNFVAVSAAGPGDLRAWASDDTIPLAAVLNYAAVPGLNLANGIILPVRQDLEGNDISVRPDASGADLVVDVVGYFSDFAPGQVVRSLSGQTDNVTLNGTNGLSVSAGSGTVTVTSTATPNNTATAIVSRDMLGNFSAGTITGNLNGTATSATTFSGSLDGEVTGTQGATAVSNAVPSNTANAIVRRDVSGSFSAGTVTLAGNLTFPGTGALVTIGGGRFLHNLGGNFNTFLGANAGNTSTIGIANTGVGALALTSYTGGVHNAAFGAQALQNLMGGDGNTAIGTGAGFYLTAGSNNIYVGSGYAGFASESNTIRIGNLSTQTAAFMAGIFGATSASGVAVFVNYDGQLGTITSSRRFKDEIADMGRESEILMKLRPVAFFYKPEYDDTRTRQYGLVAEEVAEVAPELVLSDQNGAPQTVRYHFVNAMLLNEVQKQRTTIAGQESKIQDLEARLARLEAAMARGR